MSKGLKKDDWIDLDLRTKRTNQRSDGRENDGFLACGRCRTYCARGGLTKLRRVALPLGTSTFLGVNKKRSGPCTDDV